jgi:hypothetical protein
VNNTLIRRRNTLPPGNPIPVDRQGGVIGIGSRQAMRESDPSTLLLRPDASFRMTDRS